MTRLDPIRHYSLKSTGLDHLTKSDLCKLKTALSITIDTMRSLDLDQGARFDSLKSYYDRVSFLIKKVKP